MKSVSIVIPTYNECKNITILLPQLEQLFKKHNYEILVVDDSSPDGTGEEVLRQQKKNKRIKLITRTKKEGIGAAIREGYDKATYDIIVSTDADLSFNPKDLLTLLKKIDDGYDLVVGNRHSSGGSYEKTSVSVWIKGLISKVGNGVMTRVLRLPVHDMSANFRAIKRTVWKSLHTEETGNVILGEMIIKAKKKKYTVGEIPVSFKDRIYGESKLNLLQEVPKFLIRILKYIFP